MRAKFPSPGDLLVPNRHVADLCTFGGYIGGLATIHDTPSLYIGLSNKPGYHKVVLASQSREGHMSFNMSRRVDVSSEKLTALHRDSVVFAFGPVAKNWPASLKLHGQEGRVMSPPNQRANPTFTAAVVKENKQASSGSPMKDKVSTKTLAEKLASRPVRRAKADTWALMKSLERGNLISYNGILLSPTLFCNAAARYGGGQRSPNPILLSLARNLQLMYAPRVAEPGSLFARRGVVIVDLYEHTLDERNNVSYRDVVAAASTAMRRHYEIDISDDVVAVPLSTEVGSDKFLTQVLRKGSFRPAVQTLPGDSGWMEAWLRSVTLRPAFAFTARRTLVNILKGLDAHIKPASLAFLLPCAQSEAAWEVGNYMVPTRYKSSKGARIFPPVIYNRSGGVLSSPGLSAAFQPSPHRPSETYQSEGMRKAREVLEGKLT